MTDFLKGAALALMCALAAACSVADLEKPVSETGEVTVRIDVPSWDYTRAGGEMLYPINVLVVPDGSDDVLKKIVVADGSEFSVNLESGTYDLVAVCGLESNLMPDLLSASVTIPDGADFAVGATSVTVANGTCTPSTVSITADRQMAWLDVTVTGVPENIARLNLYVRGLYETYSIDGGWDAPGAGAKRFTQFPLTKNGNAYAGGGITKPCADAMGVTYVAEATTTGGNTIVLTYTSAIPLSEGTHLTQTLAYGDMMIVEGGINLNGWDEETDDGALEGNYVFSNGQQYFSLPATVVNVGSNGTSVNIMAHRPMTVTLAEMRNWDLKHLPYTLSPEISAQRWAFPTSAISARNITNAINTIGWDTFEAQFRTNGITPIDRTAGNILAFYDKNAQKFYRYDFQTIQYEEVSDESGEFLVYPLGIIQLTE